MKKKKKPNPRNDLVYQLIKPGQREMDFRRVGVCGQNLLKETPGATRVTMVIIRIRLWWLMITRMNILIFMMII